MKEFFKELWCWIYHHPLDFQKVTYGDGHVVWTCNVCKKVRWDDPHGGKASD